MSSASRRMIGYAQGFDVMSARKGCLKKSRHHSQASVDQYALADQRVRQSIDFAAQHGPVKILWKDGKPVS